MHAGNMLQQACTPASHTVSAAEQDIRYVSGLQDNFDVQTIDVAGQVCTRCDAEQLHTRYVHSRTAVRTLYHRAAAHTACCKIAAHTGYCRIAAQARYRIAALLHTTWCGSTSARSAAKLHSQGDYCVRCITRYAGHARYCQTDCTG
jgi:hypothetical protein